MRSQLTFRFTGRLFIFLLIMSLIGPLYLTQSASAVNRKVLDCPHILFVGARGSGEVTPHQLYKDLTTNPPTKNLKFNPSLDPSTFEQQKKPKDWMGDTLGGIFEGVKRQGNYSLFNPNVPNKKRKTIAWISYGVINDRTVYPAVSTEIIKRDTAQYLREISSVNVGILKITLSKISTDCPETRYVIGGYSQGAAILRLALAKLTDNSETSVVNKIQNVVLIADPLTTPEDSRLALSKDSRWVLPEGACGIASLIVTTYECNGAKGKEFFISLATLLTSVEGWSGVFTCFLDKVKCSSADLMAFRNEIPSLISTAQVETNLRKTKVTSVCWNGDLVCSPFADRGKESSNDSLALIEELRKSGTLYHSIYKRLSYQNIVSKWILNNLN